MATHLAIQLSDGAFASLASAASAVGKSPAEQIVAIVESLYGASVPPADAELANLEFERLFGSVDLGRPVGIGNAEIDADLGREYGATCGS
jgi:hypothetical protein